MLTPIFENIPDELKQYRQWVNWREEPRRDDPTKMTKPPYQPGGKNAESNNPQTWCHFLTAKAAASQFSGIGFVLTKDDPFVGLDFDNCRCPGLDGADPIAGTLDMVQPEIAEYLRKLNAYTEISPSGHGVRVILKGQLPVDGKKKGDFEVYQSGRYVTVTGHALDEFPRTIEHREEELDRFFQAVFGAPEKPSEQERKPRMDASTVDWKDLLEKSFQSKNGAEIERLWKGDHLAYPSQSEADLALCSHLAFWLDGDSAAMDAAFRESGLYRKKWDERHHSGGGTYGQGTVEKALASCTAFYGERQSQEGEPKETAPPEAWPEPIPLNDYSHLPEFPVEAIPDTCGMMVQALADSCQV